MFRYEFFIAGSTIPGGHGYFYVVPEWNIYGTSKVFKLNELRVVTYISKLLGPFCEWEDRLKVARESGYNVIHLTPLQKLGISNSRLVLLHLYSYMDKNIQKLLKHGHNQN